MKKVFIILLVFLVVLLIACSTSKEKAGESSEQNQAIQESGVAGESKEEIAAELEETESSNLEEQTSKKEEPETAGLCYNPYFPVRPDTIWTYKVHCPDGDVYEYTSSFSGITEKSFVEKLISSEFSIDVNWLCSNDGLIQSDYSVIPFEGEIEDFEITTESYEGVILPSYDQWAVGHKWDTKYKVKTALTAESKEMTFDGDIIIANEIVSIEPVAVPFGTYTDAVKINSKKTINQDTKIEGSSMSFSAAADISSWYVEGIGLVKKVSESECGTTLVELLSVK